MSTVIELFTKALPYINIVIGIVFMLIGFKIYKPFKKEKAEDIYKKYGDLYRLGGIGMTLFGVISALA